MSHKTRDPRTASSTALLLTKLRTDRNVVVLSDSVTLKIKAMAVMRGAFHPECAKLPCVAFEG